MAAHWLSTGPQRRTQQADLDTAHVCRAAGDNTRHRRSAVIHPKVGAAPVRTPDGFLTVPVA
ncbi:MAG TPA: hypothetical protein VFX00_13290, partial [Pedococcus sp.]|nr:hypothetical protein [Pedococcus sp.]